MADDEFVFEEEGGGDSSNAGEGSDDATVDDFVDDQGDDEGELTPGDVGFDTSEGETFIAGDPPDPSVPQDTVGDSLLDPLPSDPPLAPPDLDEPAFILSTPADEARDEFGDLEPDAIRELLDTPELTSEDRDRLQDLLDAFEAENARDRIEERGDPEGEGDIEPVPVD